MKTKTTQELQLTKSGYIGLQVAQNQIHKVLKRLIGGTPIHYQHHVSTQESVMVFMGNGICATLHIQEFKPVLMKEGGEG